MTRVETKFSIEQVLYLGIAPKSRLKKLDVHDFVIFQISANGERSQVLKPGLLESLLNA